MVEFKDTAEWLQDAIANIPADMKKQFDYSYSIAERIDEQMKAKGVSTKQLAKLMGKRPSEVARWLTGRHNFTLATIAKISVALEHDFLRVI